MAVPDEPRRASSKEPGDGGSAVARLSAGGAAWRTIGNYELEWEIDHGGMGIVYRARQRGLNRIVAVKMVRGGPFADPRTIARFRREAELAARLQHPHIVRIHEIGEFEGQPYYSMDYVEGPGLDELVRDHPLPARAAASRMKTIAEAVEYAHRQGILHRDLKPSNILIDAADQPRILDFGLARSLTESHGATLGDQAIGSPGYAAPEQAAGRRDRIGPSTDVYALGAILYHLLARRPPFIAETLAATLKLVEEAEPVDVCRLNPAVPRDLATICLKCLEKDPGRRYAKAGALAEDLGRFLRDEPITARPVGWFGRAVRGCRRRPLVAGLAGALGVASVAILVGSPIAVFRIQRAREAAEREAYSASIGFAHAQVLRGSIDVALGILTNTPARYRHWEWGHLMSLCHEELATFRALPSTNPPLLAFGPGGRRLLTLGPVGTLQVWDALAEREVFRCGDAGRRASCAAIGPRSAEGCLAVGFDSGTLRCWWIESKRPGDVPGGGPAGTAFFRPGPETEAHRGRVHCLAWIDDGRRLLTGGEDGRIRVWEVEDGGWILRVDIETTWPRVRQAWLDPETDRLLARGDVEVGAWDRATSRPVETGVAERDPPGRLGMDAKGLHVVRLGPDGRFTLRLRDGGSRELVRARGLPGDRPAVFFDPSGRWVCTAGDDHTARVWRVSDGTEHLALPGRVHQAVFGPDSRHLVTLGAHNYVVLWDVEQRREIARLRGHEALVTQAAFRPDGLLLATIDQRGEVRLWAIDRPWDRWEEPNSVWGVSGSPDGRRVAMAARYEGLTVRDSVSGRQVARLRTAPEWVASTAFSPDGTRLVAGGSHRRLRVWDTRTWRRVASLAGHERCIVGVAFSRDGHRLFSYSLDGALVVRETDGWGPIRQIDTGMEPLFAAAMSADGRTLAAGDSAGLVSLWDVEEGRRLRSWSGHAQAVYAVAFSPDGTRLVTSGIDGHSRVWDGTTGRRLASWTARGCDWPVAFSEDGRRLFVGTTRYDFADHDDPQLIVRDATDGRALLSLDGLGMLTSLSYRPVDRRLVTGAFEGVARQLTAFGWHGDEGPPSAQRDWAAWAQEAGRRQWSNRLATLIADRTAPPVAGSDIDVGWEDDFFPARDPRAVGGAIELTRFYTSPLAVASFPSFGPFRTDHDLRGLPSGWVTWDGSWFDVRGVIQLRRRDARGEFFQRGWDRWPRAVTGIPVGQRCRRLRVVHGCVVPENNGVTIGTYTCVYADGVRRSLGIVYGEEVRAYWGAGQGDHGETRRGKRVWEGATPGANPTPSTIGVFLSTYDNPRPEVEIVRLDFESAMTASAPFLVALTVE